MKVTILQLNKSLLLLLLISFARPGHAQIAGPTFDSLRTARERSLFVKNEILHLVGMGRVSAVRSRKSCNCGCNIIKESFRQKGRRDYIDVFEVLWCKHMVLLHEMNNTPLYKTKVKYL